MESALKSTITDKAIYTYHSSYLPSLFYTNFKFTSTTLILKQKTQKFIRK